VRRLGFCLTAAATVCLVAGLWVAADSAAKPVLGRKVEIATNRGKIVVALYDKDAPKTCANFVKLVRSKFYDGLTFHRVEKGFVVQGGDPKGNGTGGSGKTIKLEVTPKLNFDSSGVLGMARASNPDSASSQFFITLAPAPFLDMKYAAFGKVVRGMEVAKALQKGDKMKTVRVLPRSGRRRR
jgi:peptidyl-prolyl cis-trans isomerase B (cyclophilin B)